MDEIITRYRQVLDRAGQVPKVAARPSLQGRAVPSTSMHPSVFVFHVVVAKALSRVELRVDSTFWTAQLCALCHALCPPHVQGKRTWATVAQPLADWDLQRQGLSGAVRTVCFFALCFSALQGATELSSCDALYMSHSLLG